MDFKLPALLLLLGCILILPYLPDANKNPDSNLYAKLALSYDLNTDYNVTIKQYKKAIKTNPDDSENYKKLSAVYFELGNSYLSKLYAKRAVDIDAQNNLNLYKLADENASGQPYLTVEYLKRVIKFQPENYNAHTDLGWAYFGLEDDKRALKAFKKALKIDPDNFEAYNGLAKTYEAMGKNKLSVKYYKKALQHDPQKDI